MFGQPKKKIVMAFGTFDFFHEGHEHYLKEAKKLGEYLIVVIARDRTVKQIKSEYSSFSERERLNTVKKSGLADKVVLGYHGDKYKVLKKYRPSVIALGYDQFIFTQKLEKTLIDLKINAVIQRIDAHFPQVFKSSLLKKNASQETTDRFSISAAIPKPIKAS